MGHLVSLLSTEKKKSLSFNGTNAFVLVAADGTGKFNNQSFTIEAWVKLTSISGDRTIWSYDHTSHIDPYFAMRFGISSATLQLGYNVSGSGLNYLDTGVVLTAAHVNVWTHLACTFTSGSQKIYLNGVQVGSSAVAATITFYAQPVWIGKSNFSSFFKTLMDDIRVWNVVRSQANIQANMNQELLGNESGLIAYYKCKEGMGSLLRDSTSNGYNGTLVNALWSLDGKF